MTPLSIIYFRKYAKNVLKICIFKELLLISYYSHVNYNISNNNLQCSWSAYYNLCKMQTRTLFSIMTFEYKGYKILYRKLWPKFVNPILWQHSPELQVLYAQSTRSPTVHIVNWRIKTKRRVTHWHTSINIRFLTYT